MWNCLEPKFGKTTILNKRTHARMKNAQSLFAFRKRNTGTERDRTLFFGRSKIWVEISWRRLVEECTIRHLYEAFFLVIASPHQTHHTNLKRLSMLFGRRLCIAVNNIGIHCLTLQTSGAAQGSQQILANVAFERGPDEV